MNIRWESISIANVGISFNLFCVFFNICISLDYDDQDVPNSSYLLKPDHRVHHQRLLLECHPKRLLLNHHHLAQLHCHKTQRLPKNIIPSLAFIQICALVCFSSSFSALLYVCARPRTCFVYFVYQVFGIWLTKCMKFNLTWWFWFLCENLLIYIMCS